MNVPEFIKNCIVYVMLMLTMSIISGCNDDDGDDEGTVRTIRLINAVTDSSILYLYEAADDESDDDIYLIEAEYGHGSEQQAEDGDLVSYVLYSADEDGDLQSLDLDFDLEIEAGQHVLIVVHGTMGDISFSQFEYDDLDEDDGYGQIIMLGLSENQPSVDLYLTTGDNGIYDSTVTLTANYSEIVGTVDMDEDEYNVLLAVSGDTDRIYNGGEVDIDEDNITVFAVLDTFGVEENGITMIKMDDSTTSDTLANRQNAEVPLALRFFNAVPDNVYASIDIYFGENGDTTGTPDVEALLYNEGSGYFELYVEDEDEYPDYEVTVTPHDVIGEIIYSGSLALNRGSSYSYYIAGLDEDSDVGAKLLQETFREVNDSARVNFVHASPSNDEEVDFYILERDQPVDDGVATDYDVDYLSSGNYLVESGEYDLYVVSTEDDDELVGPHRINLETGENITFVFVDRDGGGKPGELTEWDNTLDL